MIIVDNTLISEAILSEQFVCDLSKCKGGCCEDGDAGAPLDETELDLINEYYEKAKPYLTDKSIEVIEKKGRYTYSREYGWVTPTLPSDNEICIYGRREENGLIKCAFEQAYNAGIIPWKKPISCHLYPIIAEKARKGGYERLNYEPREKLCKPACSLGAKLKVPVYAFLKEPLVRKYGQEFYGALEAIAKGEHTEGKPE